MIDGCSNDRLLSVHETLGGPVDDVVEGVTVDGSPRLAVGLSTVDDPPYRDAVGNVVEGCRLNSLLEMHRRLG